MQKQLQDGRIGKCQPKRMRTIVVHHDHLLVSSPTAAIPPIIPPAVPSATPTPASAAAPAAGGENPNQNNKQDI